MGSLPKWLTGNSNKKRSLRPSQRPNSIANYTGDCRITNPECSNSGSRIIADMSAQCMCIGSECFKIAIGSRGPKVTRNGTSIIGRSGGSKYNTKRSTTKGYDKDAVSMGIPQNDGASGIPQRGAPLGIPGVTNGGKWLHKTRNCRPPHQTTTWGCIGVPCEQWPKVKSCIGCSFTVCGGARSDAEVVANQGPRAGRNLKGEVHPVLTGRQLYEIRKKAAEGVVE